MEITNTYKNNNKTMMTVKILIKSLRYRNTTYVNASWF